MDSRALDRLWTAAEVAKQLGIPAKRIRQAIRAGDLPAIRIGDWWRVRAADAERWLDRQRYQAPAA